MVAASGPTQRHQRLLPARVVVYDVLAMCLFSQVGYEEVARLLTEGLAWTRRWRGSWQMPATGAIARARRRLGAEPLLARAIMATTAELLRHPVPERWLRATRESSSAR